LFCTQSAKRTDGSGVVGLCGAVAVLLRGRTLSGLCGWIFVWLYGLLVAAASQVKRWLFFRRLFRRLCFHKDFLHSIDV